MICTGWLFHSGCSTSLSWLFYRCLQYQAPTYPAYSCVPISEVSGSQHLRSASCSKLNISRFFAAHLAPGIFQSPVRRFGTHCLIRCAIRPSSLNALGLNWNRVSGFLPDIKDTSALEVLQLQILAGHLLAYLLTRLPNNYIRDIVHWAASLSHSLMFLYHTFYVPRTRTIFAKRAFSISVSTD